MGTIINGIGITPWKGRSIIMGNMPDPGPRNYYEEMDPYNWRMLMEGNDIHDTNYPVYSNGKGVSVNDYGWGGKYSYNKNDDRWDLTKIEDPQNQTSLLSVNMLFPDGEMYKCPDIVKEREWGSFGKIIFATTVLVESHIRNFLGDYSDVDKITLFGLKNKEGKMTLRVYLFHDNITVEGYTNNWVILGNLTFEGQLNSRAIYIELTLDEKDGNLYNATLSARVLNYSSTEKVEFLVSKGLTYGVNEVFAGNGMTENDIPMESGDIVGFWGEWGSFSVTPASWSRFIN